MTRRAFVCFSAVIVDDCLVFSSATRAKRADDGKRGISIYKFSVVCKGVLVTINLVRFCPNCYDMKRKDNNNYIATL